LGEEEDPMFKLKEWPHRSYGSTVLAHMGRLAEIREEEQTILKALYPMTFAAEAPRDAKPKATKTATKYTAKARKAVSAGMRKYWKKRRAQRAVVAARQPKARRYAPGTHWTQKPENKARVRKILKGATALHYKA
jgi:hypothetical protein